MHAWCANPSLQGLQQCGGRVAKARWHCAQVGEITSGAFSPCLKKNIAMGYVEKPYAKAGTELKVCLCHT